jgi:hypothetical protein
MKSRVLLFRVARSLGEKLVCLLSSPSGFVTDIVIMSLLLTPRRGVQWRSCSSHGGAMRVVVSHQLHYPVWLACCHRGLHRGALFLRGEVVMSLYGESVCPITGYLCNTPVLRRHLALQIIRMMHHLHL